MSRYRIIRKKQPIGYTQYQVWLADRMVAMFYLRREAVEWILKQEAKCSPAS